MGFPLRHRLPLIFVVIAIILYVLTFVLFVGLDFLVNGDLYNYGLIYSDDWAIKYWSNSYLFRTIIEGAIALLTGSLLAYYYYRKNKSKLAKGILTLLFSATVLLASYSLVFLSNLDSIVINTLCDYSLYPSYAWVNSYWFYEAELFFLVLLANILLVSATLLLLSLKKPRTNETFTTQLKNNKPRRFHFSRLAKYKLNRHGARWFLVAIALAATIIFFVFYRPTVLGGNTRYEPVLSGSMEPTLPVGSLVIISPVNPDSLKVGDIICYRFSDTILITHRIVYITPEGFETRGDANEEKDSKIAEKSQIVGSVAFSVPLIGYLGILMKTTLGFLMLLLVPATLIIGYEIRSIVYEIDKMKKAKDFAENPTAK